MSACATAAGERIDARAIGELELWCVDARASASTLFAVEQDVALLSEWERRRAATFAARALAEEWLAAHIALRVVLERATGMALRGVAFARSARGKPRLDEAPIAFNISHVPGLALIALARGGTVGVDLERARAVRVREPRRARIETAGAALSRDEPFAADADARFLQAWARLEASPRPRETASAGSSPGSASAATALARTRIFAPDWTASSQRRRWARPATLRSAKACSRRSLRARRRQFRRFSSCPRAKARLRRCSLERGGVCR